MRGAEIGSGSQRAGPRHTEDGVPRDGAPGPPAQAHGLQRTPGGPESPGRAGAVPRKGGGARGRHGRGGDRPRQGPPHVLEDVPRSARGDEPPPAVLTPRATGPGQREARARRPARLCVARGRRPWSHGLGGRVERASLAHLAEDTPADRLQDGAMSVSVGARQNAVSGPE